MVLRSRPVFTNMFVSTQALTAFNVCTRIRESARLLKPIDIANRPSYSRPWNSQAMPNMPLIRPR
jgi:hypothetical protein